MMSQPISANFGIDVAKVTRPDIRPMATEATLLAAFEQLSRAGREFFTLPEPLSVSDHVDAFHAYSNMLGRALTFARMLAQGDRLAALKPEATPEITLALNSSAQGLISLLSKWFELLPRLTMNDETKEMFSLAVKTAEKAIASAPDLPEAETYQMVNDSVAHLVPGLAARMSVTHDACLDRIVKVAGGVMPFWREWLGIEPTRALPHI